MKTQEGTAVPVMNKNDVFTAEITAVSAEGSGIARCDGMAVFVPQTAPGDIAQLRIVKVKSRYAYGIVEKIEKYSPVRTENSCPVFKQCGGCVYRHISYEAECDIKRARVEDAMSRIGGIALKASGFIPAECEERYRNKAQYPVSQNGSVGFYATHSHRIVPNCDCLLQPAEFSLAAEAFGSWIRKNGISVYSEQTGLGLVRHLYLRRAETTGEIMAVIVINGNGVPAENELINELKTAVGDSLVSIQLNINTENTNVILGKKCVSVYGEKYIRDTICGISVRISPLSFFQVNRTMAERLYEKAAEYAEPDGKTVLDLYCGTGTIGLSMARRARRVIGVEVIPQAVDDARINAMENGIKNAEFICADAAVAAKRISKRGEMPQVVVLDPPRKGCEDELLRIVAEEFKPQRIVYVSCDPATLARDVSRLEARGYELLEYTPIDLFPRTAHVETVVLLSHKKPDGHINVKVEFGEGEGKVPLDNIAKRAEEYKPKERVTYKMIKEYIEAKYGFKVHTAYIAEVKRDLGLPMYDAPNAVEELKQPRKHPTAEKVEAIKDALKHFEVI